MSWKGKLKKSDLAGGGWVLESGGQQFVLRGQVPKELEGKQVEVKGSLFEGASLTMTGPIIDVDGVRSS